MKYIQIGGHYGNSPIRWCMVDDEDFEELQKYRWSANYRPKESNKVYVMRNVIKDGKRLGTVYMHREILKAPKGTDVDHIDGNTLNNQRSNIRVCSHAENMQNTKKRYNNKSGFKGVYLSQGKWSAKIKHNKRPIHLGTYNTKEEAFKAYSEACIKYHGSFANLN